MAQWAKDLALSLLWLESLLGCEFDPWSQEPRNFCMPQVEQKKKKWIKNQNFRKYWTQGTQVKSQPTFIGEAFPKIFKAKFPQSLLNATTFRAQYHNLMIWGIKGQEETLSGKKKTNSFIFTIWLKRFPPAFSLWTPGMFDLQHLPINSGEPRSLDPRPVNSTHRSGGKYLKSYRSYIPNKDKDEKLSYHRAALFGR